MPDYSYIYLIHYIYIFFQYTVYYSNFKCATYQIRKCPRKKLLTKLGLAFEKPEQKFFFNYITGLFQGICYFVKDFKPLNKSFVIAYMNLLAKSCVNLTKFLKHCSKPLYS